MNHKSFSQIFSIFKKPILTEKSYKQMNDASAYSFYVDKNTNRWQIKKAFEKLFSVEVLKVNVLNTKKKHKRMGKFQGFKPAQKKVIVFINKDQKLNIYDEESEKVEDNDGNKKS
ncbi:50S ribosomal protein L23 [symbiont of Argiope bruennichi]|uniref:50S ribosomal protein L23 n=1 Tax=symbiont of Argiope bruennichi TaxID=2810479 RepID=UPI003DA458C0